MWPHQPPASFLAGPNNLERDAASLLTFSPGPRCSLGLSSSDSLYHQVSYSCPTVEPLAVSTSHHCAVYLFLQENPLTYSFPVALGMHQNCHLPSHMCLKGILSESRHAGLGLLPLDTRLVTYTSIELKEKVVGVVGVGGVLWFVVTTLGHNKCWLSTSHSLHLLGLS